jgi:hypothetical protein
MTIPARWNAPTKERFLEDPIRYLADLYASLAAEIYAPGWRASGTVAVAAGLTTIPVVAAFDRLPVEIVVTPGWLTTFRVTGVSLTGFTIDFGTAAPGGGSTADWHAIVSEAGP